MHRTRLTEAGTKISGDNFPSFFLYSDEKISKGTNLFLLFITTVKLCTNKKPETEVQRRTRTKISICSGVKTREIMVNKESKRTKV
jgi:hypothetical protein